MPGGRKGVVILGTTSAIARAIARDYAKNGWDLVLGARDEEENELLAQDLRVRYCGAVQAAVYDAERFEDHEAFVNGCFEALGGSFEGVVLCSGFMAEQEIAESDWEVAKRMIDVNFSGVVSVLNHFANRFSERERGFIAVLSSVAGDRGRQSNYLYGSAKAGLTAYLEGLRNRLYHSGVHVVTIKPGFMDTKMTWGKPGLFLVASPEAAARAIVRAIAKRKNVAYVPWFWRYIMLIIRHIPEWQFKKMRM